MGRELVSHDKIKAGDALEMAERFSVEAGFVWPDSSMGRSGGQSRSLIAFRPKIEIRYADGEMTSVAAGSRLVQKSSPLAVLEQVERLVAESQMVAIGYCSYEAGVEMIGLTARALPYASIRFFLYDSVVEVDCEREIEGGLGLARRGGEDRGVSDGVKVGRSVGYGEYVEKVKRILEHIYEGDIYQANFTNRFVIEGAGTPWEVYRRLRGISPSPYGAYMNFGDMQVLSSSPERMLLREGERVMTSPIKGTIAAGGTREEQAESESRLLHSEKDRAELLMIVDLERNDLGKVARTGSVRVDALFRAEAYRSLIHMVSDVSAEVSAGMSTAKVLEALLPGGSITGAPKRRAIEILQELEADPRGVYTGCIGYMQPGKADFNIAIRTMICQNGKYHVHAGGGIVADSRPEAEFEEMLLKGSNMFRALGMTEEEIACLRR